MQRSLQRSPVARKTRDPTTSSIETSLNSSNRLRRAKHGYSTEPGAQSGDLEGPAVVCPRVVVADGSVARKRRVSFGMAQNRKSARGVA